METFEIGEVVGKGGMASIHSGTKLGKPVAIKILSEPFSINPELIRLFDKEANILSCFNSPHIPRYEGRGTHEKKPFFAMELVKGEDLGKVVSEGRRPSDNGLLHIAKGVALALAEVHEKGIVHCDVKPANILMDAGGRTKLVDFGIARFVADQDDAMGCVAATCENMSPEQGAGGRMDARSDIYSLGTVLYELASGKPVFKDAGSFTEMLFRHHYVEPPPIEAISPPIKTILERCLVKRRSGRYQSAAELIAAIDEAAKTIDPSSDWWRQGNKAA
jgi:serine/threonine protein kinase